MVSTSGRCFCLLPIFWPSACHHICILFTFLVCDASHHHRKRLIYVLLFFLAFFSCEIIWYLLHIGFMSFQLCGCFSRRCSLFWSILAPLFSLRFWLMPGTASFWVGSEFSHLDVIFLVVGLPSIVPPRFGFQDLFFFFVIWFLYSLS